MLLVDTFLAQSAIHGIGLFAAQAIPSGTIIWRFTPGFDIRLSDQELTALPASLQPFLERYGWKSWRSKLHCFSSDDGRFFNHSEKPNCRSEHRADEEEVVTIALRDITAGEELTDDYATFDADFPEVSTNRTRFENARTKQSVHLKPMEPQDFAWYDKLARAEPHFDENFFSGGELRELCDAGTVQAWLVLDGETTVGWCSVFTRSPHHPLPDSVHLLGGIVVPALRGKGYGEAMVSARVGMFPSRPLTVSISPGNTAIEHIVARHGFEAGLMHAPWRMWHRRAEGARRMVLVQDGVTRRSATADYVEAWVEPTETGGGRILRGFWPDPAAFHETIRCDTHRDALDP